MMTPRKARRKQHSPVKHSGPLEGLQVDSGLQSGPATTSLGLSLRVKLRMQMQVEALMRRMKKRTL